jgi:hypothetical protein
MNNVHPADGKIIVRKAADSDREAIIAIFNHYAATSYAAYPEIPVNDRFFTFLHEGAVGFYVLEHEAPVVGFGLMKMLMPFPAFMTTGILYQLHPSGVYPHESREKTSRPPHGRCEKNEYDLACCKHGLKK